MNLNILPPSSIFDYYPDLGSPLAIEPVTIGLINKTYLVTTDKLQFILQEVSSIFDTTINDDSEAVSIYLEQRGMIAPRIFKTKDLQLFVRIEGRIFRALKYIKGVSRHIINSLIMAESAGKVVGHFHAALKDFSYDYRSKRRHGGDYDFHQANLENALNHHQQHDYFKQVEPLAIKMLKEMKEITLGLCTTARNAHGDPKISNIIFDQQDNGICLIDFDTLGKTGWSLEMADALRSWCNARTEDIVDAQVDLTIAEKALVGYGSIMRGSFTDKEAQELLSHTQAITLCLAMRFLTDVLIEKYWAFDQSRFLRPADHNWLRAQAMHNLFYDFGAKRKQLEQMVGDLLL